MRHEALELSESKIAFRNDYLVVASKITVNPSYHAGSIEHPSAVVGGECIAEDGGFHDHVATEQIFV